MILDPATLPVFVAASMALLITPGPAVLYIIARSVDQGRWAGVVSALGLGLGTIVQVVAAALGVSALLTASALAFRVVKLAGAAYLVYLGIHKLFIEKAELEEIKAETRPLGCIFVQGIVVNVLNPKLALFFFAFLPQFIDPARGAPAAQVMLLGLLFVMLAICSDSLYALFAGTVGGWLRGNLAFRRVQKTFAGVIYLALGAVTAFTGADSQ
jgi:threonine/homoserine/homoserine lactone efflux protein